MKITDFGYNGEGVGHIDGKVCFVLYTLTGEEVDVKITKQTSSFLKGVPSRLVLASDLRQKPPCPYFEKCGGCDFQHMSYENEIELKKQILERHLKKVGYEGKIEIHSSDKDYGYRNKIRLFCCTDGLGFKQAESNNIIPIKKCLLIDERMNEVLEVVQNFIKAQSLQKRLLNVIIRKQSGVHVWFVFKQEVDIDFLGLSLLLGNDCQIYQSVGSDNPQRVTNKTSREVEEFGMVYNFHVDAFRQVNDAVYEKLYNKVAEIVKGEVVLNAYSGAGVLSGVLAKRAKVVYGVELGLSEHESAEKLKEKNNISNLKNLQGYCEEVLPNLDVRFDSVVVDPPRKGCDKTVVEALNKSGAKQIVYVSCNPASLVRDIVLLNGYRLKQVEMFDMFPRTANCETLAILEKT